MAGDLSSIEGVAPSEVMRAELAAPGRPVLLAFSRGKDAIGAWLALRDAGVEVVPYHLELIPGLQFVRDSLAYFEEWFGQRIIRLPHPSFYRWLRHRTFQPPERWGVIHAAQIPRVEYPHIYEALKVTLGLPADTWVCNGVRAADSPQRRLAMANQGPWNHSDRSVAITWDWRIAKVRAEIAAAGIELPVDYELWGRSFDGVDHRFLAPMRRALPEDFERLLHWLPLADLFLFRCADECCADYPRGPHV